MTLSVVESTFAVDNMFCGGCAATVERAVRRLPGVHDVSVSFLGDTAIVEHDKALITDSDVRHAITRLGYNTRSVDDPQSARQSNVFEKQLRIRFGVAAGFGLWVMMASMVRLFIDLPTPELRWSVALFSGVVSIPVLSYSAWPFLKLGWLGLRERVPGMDSLILLATLSAVTGSLLSLYNGQSDVWFEVPVMLVTFQLFARLADFGAHRKSTNAVRELLDLSPVKARRLNTDGSIDYVPLADLVVGDHILSHAGERLCMDGEIIQGEADIDCSLLNGETNPQRSTIGDTVSAGTLNLTGMISIKINAAMGKRRVDVLASAVGRLLNRKSNLMKLADRFAFYLVPALIVVATSVFITMLLTNHSPADALQRALAVLVVSCPCALSLAVPLVVSVTAAKAARNGILLRDASALEDAGKITTVLLDKTGTLTRGKPRIVHAQLSSDWEQSQLVSLVAHAGQGSNHPLMSAIRVASHDETSAANAPPLKQSTEVAGKGIASVLHNGQQLVAGSRQWLIDSGVTDASIMDASRAIQQASVVHVAIDTHWVGSLYLADELRADAQKLIKNLRDANKNIMLVSGDRPECVKDVADHLGIEWRAGFSPENKADLVASLNKAGQHVAFVGDGLNDAPALAAAAVGIATGKASDLARSASAMAVLDGGLEKIISALQLSAKAGSVLRQNLVLAVLYNALLLPAAMFGYVHPVMAVLAMLLSVVSVSFNTLRTGLHATA